MFFAWRIRRLTESNWIPILVAIFAFTSFGTHALPISSFDCIQLHRGIAGGVWTAIRIIVLGLFSMKPQFETPAMVWFLAACIADLLIAVTLVTYLVRYGVF